MHIARPSKVGTERGGGGGDNRCHWWGGGRKIRLSLFIHWERFCLLFAPVSIHRCCCCCYCRCVKNLILLCLYINRSDTEKKNGLWINRMTLFNWIIIGFRKHAASYHRNIFFFALALGLLCLFVGETRLRHEMLRYGRKRVSGYYKPIKADKWRNEFSFRFGAILLFHGDREREKRRKEKLEVTLI